MATIVRLHVSAFPANTSSSLSLDDSGRRRAAVDDATYLPSGLAFASVANWRSGM